MKLSILSHLIFSFGLFEAVSAFAPSLTPSRETTAIRLVPDPEFMHHLAQNCADAIGMTVMECDNNECAEATGLKQGDGDWYFQGGLTGDGRETSKRILGMVMDDCE